MDEQRGRLVLTRERGQSVRVGDAVITIASVERGKVRLVFEAPKSVRILRTEIDRSAGDAASGSGN